MHSFELHSNESACRNIGRLGLEQVIGPSVDSSVSKFVFWTRTSEALVVEVHFISEQHGEPAIWCSGIIFTGMISWV